MRLPRARSSCGRCPFSQNGLGSSGKCDIVEQRADGLLFPVEYKKGKRRKFDNDEVQLCAQALCLEEMFGARIERGAIFHAASKRRREIDFDPPLRTLTETTVADLHRMMEAWNVPAAVFKPQCQECSLYEICVPELTSLPDRLRRHLKSLFAIENPKPA